MEIALIVAGGSGTRMQTSTPKQFLEVAGKPILQHTISAFRKYSSDIRIIVVLPKPFIAYWEGLDINMEQVELVAGGDTRFHSVKNGLQLVHKEDVIAIHDGVRPVISTSLIQACFTEAATHGSAIPVLKPKDSLRKRTSTGSKAVDRSEYLVIQTPQTFQGETIIPAYNLPFQDSFTDDASVVEHAGFPVHLIEGEYNNIKITTSEDLLLAEALLAQLS